jgi:hypothetical protein
LFTFTVSSDDQSISVSEALAEILVMVMLRHRGEPSMSPHRPEKIGQQRTMWIVECRTRQEAEFTKSICLAAGFDTGEIEEIVR